MLLRTLDEADEKEHGGRDGDEVTEDVAPQATQPREIEIIVHALRPVVEGRSALYVSSPLTSGQRAFDWDLRNGRLSDATSFGPKTHNFHREVVEPNRQEADRYVRHLRETTRRVVINPAALEDLAGWSQADYRVLWGRVIERYAEAVVFLEGWQYSSGCAYEFLVAHASGARLLRGDLTPLTLEEGRALLGAAVEESRARKAPTDFLEWVRKSLAEARLAREK